LLSCLLKTVSPLTCTIEMAHDVAKEIVSMAQDLSDAYEESKWVDVTLGFTLPSNDDEEPMTFTCGVFSLKREQSSMLVTCVRTTFEIPLSESQAYQDLLTELVDQTLLYMHSEYDLYSIPRQSSVELQFKVRDEAWNWTRIWECKQGFSLYRVYDPAKRQVEHERIKMTVLQMSLLVKYMQSAPFKL
jgi:hypothetical protein